MPDAVHILLLGLIAIPSAGYNYSHFPHEDIKTMLKYHRISQLESQHTIFCYTSRKRNIPIYAFKIFIIWRKKRVVLASLQIKIKIKDLLTEIEPNLCKNSQK